MSQLSVHLPFTSPKHKQVLHAVNSRKRYAEQHDSRNRQMWDRAEAAFRAYVPDTDEDLKRKVKRGTGKYDYIKITIPYSTAILMTAHMYWSSVFLSRSPVMQVRGLSGQGEQNIQAMEALLDYQLTIGEMYVPMYTWLLDAGKYGRGILGNFWETDRFSLAYVEERQREVAGIPVENKFEKVLKRSMVTGYEGNRLYNIRPHDFLPDPRVSLPNLQRGEFVGTVWRNVSWNTILKRAAQGIYFNIDELRKGINERSGYDNAVPTVDFPDTGDPVETSGRSKGNLELTEMTIEIVPSLWDLGSSNYPEKWIFTVANDAVVIGARPLGCLHNKFPFSVLEYEIDGYSVSGRGILEVLDGLNFTLSWLVNSHLFNVRQILNGTMVVDPSRVQLSDFDREGPGRLIRLRALGYGQDPRMLVHRLDVQDVTQTHLRDMQVIMEMMQRIVGASDNVMGQLHQGGRKTATEVRTSSTFGVNRLKLNAEYFSAMGFSPLSRMLMANTQQYYDRERKFRIAGDQMQNQQFIDVTPDSIAGEWDYMPVDGTLPIDRFAQAALWKEMMQSVVGLPQIAQSYDVGGIFSWVAKLAGLKNIDQFKIEVLPPGAQVPPNLTPIQGGRQPSGGQSRQTPVGNVGQAGPPA